jgi:hypothetical protein
LPTLYLAYCSLHNKYYQGFNFDCWKNDIACFWILFLLFWFNCWFKQIVYWVRYVEVLNYKLTLSPWEQCIFPPHDVSISWNALFWFPCLVDLTSSVLTDSSSCYTGSSFLNTLLRVFWALTTGLFSDLSHNWRWLHLENSLRTLFTMVLKTQDLRLESV